MSGDDHASLFESRVRALVAGFSDAFPASSEQVVLGGREMTLAEVAAALQQMVDSFDSVHRARTALRQAVSERRRSMPGFRSTYEDAVILLKHHLGKANPRLVTFGLQLPKPRRALTVEENAIARAKAAATRRARGTLGRRQRSRLGRASEPTLQVFGPDGQPLVPVATGSTLLPADPQPRGDA